MALAAISTSLNRTLLHSTSFFGSTLSRTARLNLHDLIRGPFIRGFSTFTSRGDIILYQGNHKGELGDVVQNKGRPNLVVSSDFVTKKTGNFLLAPMSTAPKRFDFEVELPSDDQTKLRELSKVMTNQVFTANRKEGRVKKIGSALTHMSSVDNALKICFGDLSVKAFTASPMEIARGDFVEIDDGNALFEGIVVSNDLGNLFSRIAMVADSTFQSNLNRDFDEFSVKISVECQDGSKEMLIRCHDINTFSQTVMIRKGKVKEVDMKRIITILHSVLGIST